MKQLQEKTLNDIREDIKNLINSIDFNYWDNNCPTLNSYNPSNGYKITNFPELNEQSIDRIVAKAKKTFDSKIWSYSEPSYRKKVLLNFANLIEINRYELALLDTIDTGMPLNNSFFMEIPFSVKCLKWYAELIDKNYGKIAETKVDQFVTITKEPIGVVAAILPWNAPIMIALTKIAPALSVGNSVILKPSEHASLSVIKLYELSKKAGFPEGVFNIATGKGDVAGKALGLHKDINCLSFVGSTAVGKKFLTYSGLSNMKKISLECGGKSASILYEDCYDLDKALIKTLEAGLFNQGAVCMASSRILIEKNIYDIAIKKILKYVKIYKAAEPLNLRTNIGPMINEAHLDKVLCYIKLGLQEKAKLVYGGTQSLKETGGYFIDPTIFIDVNNDMRIAQEEIFGPVISVIPFEGEEGINIANNTKYGLASVIWTKDFNKGNIIAKQLSCGLVRINTIETGGIQAPFGGYKESGIGRDRSNCALNEYTEVKSTVFNFNN